MVKNNYRLIADYHTHTIYSKNGHAKGTIRENIEQGLKLGLKEIYITDHGPGHPFFGISRKKIPIIRKEIDELNKEYNGRIKIIFGVEANIVDYDGKYDLKKDEEKYFDKINLGYHNGVMFNNFKSFFIFHILNRIGKLNKRIRNYCIEKNTDAIIKIIEEKNIHVVTHPNDKVKVNLQRLAKACKKNNTLMEINSHHTHLNVDEIKALINTGVGFSVGSDAHRPEDVGIIDNSIKRIEESGLDIKKVKNLEMD